MVLPLLPVVESLDDIFNMPEVLTTDAVQAIGQVMVQGNPLDIEKLVSQISKVSVLVNLIVDVDNVSQNTIVQLLDAGASQIVVQMTQLTELNDIPKERIVLRVSEHLLAAVPSIEGITNSAAGFILDSTFAMSVDTTTFKFVVNSLRNRHLPAGGEPKIFLQYSRSTPQPTIPELKSLSPLSIVPILPLQCLTSSPKEYPTLLPVVQVALLGANTDRSDGLYSTIVANERGQVLGLVYSSAESIAESIRTGAGVYQSRNRGLWYKGATSGATQKLLGFSWDCDSDCLLYTVKQEGKGFYGFVIPTD